MSENEHVPEDELLHSIEFTEDGKLFTIRTYSFDYYNKEYYIEEYYVEYDNKNQGWYHNSGGGPEDNLLFERGEGLTLIGDPKVNTLGNIIEKFDLLEGEVVWCDKCKCFYPEEKDCYIRDVLFNGIKYEEVYILCDHIFWNGELGWWDGPGSDEATPEEQSQEMIICED